MKLKQQTQYFINGAILIVIALLCVTILPVIVKAKFNIPNYAFYQIEFFILCVASIFFLFSPKYYKEQIITVLIGAIYYILFCKVFN